MAVTITVSTNAKIKVFSSDAETTMVTAFSDVINELETHNIPAHKITYQLVTDGQSTPKYVFMAVCKLL